jgi:hypothetical protein
MFSTPESDTIFPEFAPADVDNTPVVNDGGTAVIVRLLSLAKIEVPSSTIRWQCGQMSTSPARGGGS